MLDIGCKQARLGDVNLDADYSVRPDVVGCVHNLPIKDKSFGRVIFSEVVEHLPQGSEGKALTEIARVLTTGGELILTTPNDYWFYTLTDPAYILRGHRHYKKHNVIALAEENNFRVKKCFVRGGFWCFLFMTWYYLLTYTFGIQVPKFLAEKERDDYTKDNEKGFTVFVVGEKV